MQQTDWPGQIWSEGALLEMVGRIASNNFGMYSTKQTSQPQQQQHHHKHCNTSHHAAPTASAVAQQAATCHSQPPMMQEVHVASSDGHQSSPQPEPYRQGTLQEPTDRLAVSSNQPTGAVSEPLCSDDSTQLDARSEGFLAWPLTSAGTEQWQGVMPEQMPSAAHQASSSSSQAAADQLCMDHAALCKQHLQSGVAPTSPEGPNAEQPQQLCKDNVADNEKLQRLQRPVKEDVIGREMYITASFFNHSCEPNCVKHRSLGQQSGVATITALRPIEARSLPFVEDVAVWGQ